MNLRDTTSYFASQNRGLWFLAIAWSLVVLTPLIYFPAPLALVGHPWKVELTISLVLAASLAYYLIKSPALDKPALPFSSQITSFIITPCCALILWSAASAFWAGSASSVFHHTAVWAGYLIFFLFAVYIAANKKLLKISVTALGLVVSLICICCIIEFTMAAQVGDAFGFRYSRYAEIFASLLPLFFSFTLRLKGKNLLLAASATLLLWLGILSTLSRGALLTSIAGLFVFAGLRILTPKSSFEKKRLAAAAGGIILVFLLLQLPTLLKQGEVQQNASTFARLSINDEKDPTNSLSKNVRFLFTGVGLEMFSGNYLLGVGADNFGLEFNRYRAIFSAKPENKPIAGMQEWLLPERAHNEYLQILTELGAVGAAIFLFFILGIAKLSFCKLKENRLDHSNILTHAALAGVAAFLVSSSFSSFSFRLMQNGLVFFFLLAILLREFAAKKTDSQKTQVFFIPNHFKSAFIAVSLAACFSLAIYSALKAASQFLTYSAERQENLETAESNFQRAGLLDPGNGSANFSYGLRLINEGFYPEAAAELQEATKKGLNTSICYSYLISAQTLANQNQAALQTASEAVDVYPYSVFLRVRYAVLLDKNNRENEAAAQLAAAHGIDKPQAETWRLLIGSGAQKASLAARSNKDLLQLMALKPDSAVDAILLEREIVHPDEKMKFNF